MRNLVRLQKARSLTDVAALLGYQAQGLSYILYKLPTSDRYRQFSIPKRNGGTRIILAPESRLKLVQSRLARLLNDCLDEIAGSTKPQTALSHGFTRGRSIVTNASMHRGRRYVLNFDLEDFFGSINFGRIRGLLVKV